jgi:hypothetical protein
VGLLGQIVGQLGVVARVTRISGGERIQAQILFPEFRVHRPQPGGAVISRMHRGGAQQQQRDKTQESLHD